MVKQPDTPNKREVPRLKREITIHYKVKQAPLIKGAAIADKAVADISRTKDLSEKGIFFTAGHELPAQTILEIKLRVPTEREDVDLEGRVVHCEETAKNLLYKVRVVFVNLRQEQKATLRSFIQRFSKG